MRYFLPGAEVGIDQFDVAQARQFDIYGSRAAAFFFLPLFRFDKDIVVRVALPVDLDIQRPVADDHRTHFYFRTEQAHQPEAEG